MRDQLRSAQTLGAAILLVGAALVVGYRRQSSDSTAETSQHRQSRIKNAASHSIIQTSAVPENTSTTSPTSPPKSVNIPSTDTNMLGQPILITPPSPAPIKYVDVVEQSIDNYVLSDLVCHNIGRVSLFFFSFFFYITLTADTSKLIIISPI